MSGIHGQISFIPTLVRRVYEHKNSLVKGFTKKYNVTNLVYFEIHSDIREAILREKIIKKWRRDWKINLIESNNPYWWICIRKYSKTYFSFSFNRRSLTWIPDKRLAKNARRFPGRQNLAFLDVPLRLP